MNKLFEHKRAQTLSMNVIIIAALALLVLVIVAMIFSSRTRTFTTTTRACTSKGEGASCKQECLSNEVVVGNSKDTECESVCCLPLYDGGVN